jgi:hypothetical protein
LLRYACNDKLLNNLFMLYFRLQGSICKENIYLENGVYNLTSGDIQQGINNVLYSIVKKERRHI